MHVVSVLFGRHILIGGPGDRARRIAAMPGGRGREQVDHEWLCLPGGEAGSYPRRRAFFSPRSGPVAEKPVILHRPATLPIKS